MKHLPAGMQDHLDTGATTLCWCWRLIRNDGTVLGFTDHDKDLQFEGTVFQAATGFTASEISGSIGLNIDNMDADGILNSDSLTESELSAGVYDNATVELYRVNWQNTAQHILMQSGSIGEVQRGQHAFTAEIRGLAHYLQQLQGRMYQYGCDANLGDLKCGIDLESASFKGIGSVQNVTNDRTFVVSGLEVFNTDWFANGILTWETGLNEGQAYEVKYHTVLNSNVIIELWSAPVLDVNISDTFKITAGCNKQFTTCKEKFSNIINFRGFPHIPGNDFTLSYPNRDDGNNDGGSMQ